MPALRQMKEYLFNLLFFIREEFHRRLKVYHAWKAKNKKKGAGAAKDPFGMGAMMGAAAGANATSPTVDMSFEEGMRAPNSVLEEAARTPSAAIAVERKAVVSNQDQARYQETK